jgi:esterase/lipase superfamily enzyme
MQKEIHSFRSNHLSKNVEIAVYGRYGFAILLFPTFSDDHLENEKFELIESIAGGINKGKFKVFSVPGINFESWLNNDISPKEKSDRHYQYNNFIIEEVVPFIFGECGGPVPIISAGASMGAYHAANTYFRRPDILYGVIAMSGTYNIEHYTKGYFDDNCYFNSPIHYLPNLTDSYWLSFLVNKKHCYILSGSGENEFPDNSNNLANILNSKGIPHQLCIWGTEYDHNWKTWNAMLPHILDNNF